LTPSTSYSSYAEPHPLDQELVPATSPQWSSPGDARTSNVRQWQGSSTELAEIPVPLGRSTLDLSRRSPLDQAPEDYHGCSDVGLTSTRGPTTLPLGRYAPAYLVLYEVLPQTIPATCPLDNILCTFIRERRAMAAQGVPVEVLVGPPLPNFATLVCREADIESHPLSKLFTDIVRTFPDISGLPEQIAVVYVMFLLMRWITHPTPANYHRLPVWIMPRASQLFTKHPCWMDLIPW
jgi:hypothetical protein